jgi:hypothetical protein
MTIDIYKSRACQQGTCGQREESCSWNLLLL